MRVRSSGPQNGRECPRELSQVPEGSWRVSEVSNKRANKTRRVGGQRKMIAPESFAARCFDFRRFAGHK